MKNQLWVEKYRPDTVDGYVFTDDISERSESKAGLKKVVSRIC